jgi:hypothetical protein
VPLRKDADLIISDIYPFDMDLQFGFDRGIWPFEHAKKATQKVLLANCARGIGGHDLFPVSNPIQSRITRRIVNFQLKDLTQIGSRLQSIRNILWRRSLHVIVVSPNISESELKTVLPKGQVVMNWQDALDKLVKLQTNKTNVKVVIYKASPLLLANFQDGTI